MTIPAIKTSRVQLTEDYAADPQRTLLMALLSDLGAVTGGSSHLPEFADQNEVERKARDDFRRSDYSDALTYIDSLVKIADHWQQWAETYHSALVSAGATFGEYGDPSLDSFAVTRGGKWLTGSGDSFDIDDPDCREDATYYLRRWIPTITNEPTKERAAKVLLEIGAKMSAPVPDIPGFGPNPADALTIRKETP